MTNNSHLIILNPLYLRWYPKRDCSPKVFSRIRENQEKVDNPVQRVISGVLEVVHGIL